MPSQPVPGEIYAMPLSDGRWGACRVLRRATGDDAVAWGARAVLVEATQYIGAEPPSLDHPDLTEPLILTHHSWKGVPDRGWLRSPAPEEFVRLGVLPTTEAERVVSSRSSQAWGGMALQRMLQWRWEHEHDAVLREDAEEAAHQARAAEQVARQASQRLAQLTLQDLLNKPRFETWDWLTPTLLQECRGVLTRTIQDLITLGRQPARHDTIACLQHCIEDFNTLDTQHQGFIETLEREAICEEFYEIAAVAGIGDEPQLADRWREW